MLLTLGQFAPARLSNSRMCRVNMPFCVVQHLNAGNACKYDYENSLFLAPTFDTSGDCVQ
jgi:hypothetical protein